MKQSEHLEQKHEDKIKLNLDCIAVSSNSTNTVSNKSSTKYKVIIKY